MSVFGGVALRARSVVPAMVAAFVLLAADAQGAGDNTRADFEQRFGALAVERAQRAAFLAEPAQREQRLRSRTAFEGLGDAGAAALAEQSFASIFAVAAWSPDAGLRASGQKVEEFLDERTARVTLPGGKKVLATSSVAMRPKDAGRPADLALSAEGAFAAPRNGLGTARVRTDRSAAIDFGPGSVAFTPRTGGKGGVPRSLASWRFVPNALPDTDYEAGVSAIGAEAAWVLRSARSPELLELDVALTEGQTLVANDPMGARAGGARVIDAGGQTVAELLAPTALDADGTPVAISMSVQGARAVLQIAHRSLDVRYPVYADPIIHNQRDANGFTNYENWSATVVGNPSPRVSSGTGPGPCAGNALCLTAFPFSTYDYATTEFIYSARPNTFIYRADFGPLTAQVDQNSAAYFEGLLDQANGRWEPDSHYWASQNFGYTKTRSPPTPARAPSRSAAAVPKAARASNAHTPSAPPASPTPRPTCLKARAPSTSKPKTSSAEQPTQHGPSRSIGRDRRCRFLAR